MDIINILLILIIVVDFILVVISLVGNKDRDETTLVYLINVATIAWWAGSMVFYRTSSDGNIVLLTKNLYVSATVIASSFYYFSLIFPKREKKHYIRALNILVVNLIVIYLTVVTDTIIFSAKVNPNGENIIYFGRYYILYVIYILYFFLTSFIRLLIKKIKTVEKTEKLQLYYLFIGYSISGNIAFLSNLLLPWFGYFSLNWLGQVATITMAGSITYAVTKHKLFNSKVITTELFIFILWIFTTFRTFLSGNPTDLTINIVFLILVIIIGLFLIRSVKREVDQRERIETLARDLEKSNERLKELDQMKSEFVSLATHQIRSPLTAIKGYISLIQEGDYGPVSKEVKGAIDVVYQSTNNLVTIVGDFLDVSRIEQGRMKYEFKDFDIYKLTSQVVTELKPNVEKKGLELQFTFEKNKDYTVFGDQGKVKQVIGNIIDNSIKYTPAGKIDVTLLKPTNFKVLIRISDTGIGIDPRVIPKLFQKFTRAENANDENIIGTGLGLYVARLMVEAHKGRVWVESEGKGKGSKFYIELPIKP
jgi:signal transduction histidine kinase